MIVLAIDFLSHTRAHVHNIWHTARDIIGREGKKNTHTHRQRLRCENNNKKANLFEYTEILASQVLNTIR